MASIDEERPKKPTGHVVGQDIALLSVAELSERIAQLETEIERIGAERTQRGATKTAAEALFRR